MGGSTSEVVIDTEVDNKCETTPKKKKRKSYKGEQKRKEIWRGMKPEIGASLWDKKFDQASFVNDHLSRQKILRQRKANHFSLFRDVNVSCLCYVVLLELMKTLCDFDFWFLVFCRLSEWLLFLEGDGIWVSQR